MAIVNYATLCLLITYHWHASWAVSTWPSGGPGIAAEVNGSPTDASLNIPVVKRSSNQAELANELPLPGRPVSTSNVVVVVVVVDADSPSKLVEFPAVGTSDRTHREYANRTTENNLKAIVSLEASKKMMIERVPHRGHATNLSERERTSMKNATKMHRREEREKERLAIVRKSLISTKELAALNQLIGRMNSPSSIRPWMFPASRWFHYKGAFTATNRRPGQRYDPSRRYNNAAFRGVAETKIAREKINAINEIAIDGSAINLIDISENHDTQSNLPTSLSRNKRQALFVDAERINNSKVKVHSTETNQDKITSDYDTPRLSNGTPLLSTSESLKRLSLYDDRNKPSGTSSGITSSLGVTKLLDSSRLHQQSRNTKPRTAIVQHLRGSTVPGQTLGYYNSPRLPRSHEFYEQQLRHVEPRFSTRPLLIDPRYRKPPVGHRFDHFSKFNSNPNQLRFIPYYNNYGKNTKSFESTGPNDSAINQVNLPVIDQLTESEIANFSSFNPEQIDNLRKSLSGVFDRNFLPARINILPNVRPILPKQVFIAPPRLIYDTKILPAPFSLQNFFHNSDNRFNSNEDNDEPVNDSSSPVNKEVLDDQRVGITSEKSPTIPVGEDLKESVTSSEKFVTPLPPSTSQVTFGVNQPKVPLVSTLPDEIYRVRGLEEMEHPSKVPEYETFQRDTDEPRVNHKSPSETGVKDHPGNMRSSYDNSGSTYASKDQTGTGNVDHSPVIEAINDEYPNHQTTRHPDVSNIESDVRIPTSQLHDGQNDDNYDRGSNKWRENDDNDYPRYVAKYKFGYLVNDDNSRNDFGHEEMRDEGITKGRYHVRLPDGRIQKVNYQVDDNGYRAVVSYQRDNVE